MTKEEFRKIPIKFVGDISMEGEHQRSTLMSNMAVIYVW